MNRIIHWELNAVINPSNFAATILIKMKKTLVLLFLQFLSFFSPAQTGWKISEQDPQATKLNLIESTPDGKFYQLTFNYSLPPFSCQIKQMDSTGTLLLQTSFNVAGNQPSIRSFRIDTVQQRILVFSQSSDATQFNMQLKVLDYNLIDTDSASFSLLKSNADSCDLIGGGIDNTANKFLVYRYRDIVDQIWVRGVTRKSATGTYKSVTAKVGQATNDGYYINDVAVTPVGNLFIGGYRSESLYGKFFFLEKLNASMIQEFEVKDQLILGNFENNHVSCLHVYTNNSNSQVVVGGTMYGLAPGDTIIRCHGVIRCYTFNGTLKWNYQNYEVRDYKKIISKRSYVHAIGSANNNPGGYDTKISRLFLKDGVVHWQRYFSSKSIASVLQVERDGSLLIGGDKQYSLPLLSGGTLKIRSYMLIRYSKFGKRLFDFNYNWNLPFNPTAVNASFNDIACGRSTFYYATGWSRINYENAGGPQIADSILLQQFANGALKTNDGAPAASGLRVHPNPASNEIHFTLRYQLTDVQMVSTNGTFVTIDEIHQDGNAYYCDVTDLPPGVYILKVRTEKGWEAATFVKQ